MNFRYKLWSAIQTLMFKNNGQQSRHNDKTHHENGGFYHMLPQFILSDTKNKKWNAYNFSEQVISDEELKTRINGEGEKDPLVIEMRESLKEDGKEISYSEARETLENEICFGEVENINETNKIIFCTVWSAPDPVLEKLSEMFPEALIIHQWAEEDFGYNVGTREYENGELVFEDLPDGGTKASYEMAAEIMGINLSDIGLKLSPETNNYEYVDKAEKEETNSKIKVVLVKPMMEAKIVEIDSGLKSMQETVGGLIECIQPFENTEIAVICNEEGKINGLELNRSINDTDGNMVDIIAGDFFICAARSDEENFAGLTDEEANKYCEKFKSPELFFRNISGVTSVKISGKESPEMER